MLGDIRAVADDIAWAIVRMRGIDAARVTEESWEVLQGVRLARQHGAMGAAIAACRWRMTSVDEVRAAMAEAGLAPAPDVA